MWEGFYGILQWAMLIDQCHIIVLQSQKQGAYTPLGVRKWQIYMQLRNKSILHQELTPFPPFGNINDVQRDNEVLVIDKDYDRVSDLVREGDVFAFIAPVDNP